MRIVAGMRAMRIIVVNHHVSNGLRRQVRYLGPQIKARLADVRMLIASMHTYLVRKF